MTVRTLIGRKADGEILFELAVNAEKFALIYHDRGEQGALDFLMQQIGRQLADTDLRPEENTSL
jgi:hypothetical protein